MSWCGSSSTSGKPIARQFARSDGLVNATTILMANALPTKKASYRPAARKLDLVEFLSAFRRIGLLRKADLVRDFLPLMY